MGCLLIRTSGETLPLGWTPSYGQSSGINSFILQELHAYSVNRRLDIIVHQEEPRTHCTSTGSANWLKDPNIFWQSVWHCLAYSGLYIAPWICFPHHNWHTNTTAMLNDLTGSITFSIASFMSVAFAQDESALISEKRRVAVVNLPIWIVYDKCQLGSTVQGSDHRAH